MQVSCYIIKSSVKGEENWSGKEFSDLPAKIYADYQDVFNALEGYWFHHLDRVMEPGDDRVIKIVPLTDEKMYSLLNQNKIRY